MRGSAQAGAITREWSFEACCSLSCALCRCVFLCFHVCLCAGPKLYLAATTTHVKQKAMMRDQPLEVDDAALTPNPLRQQQQQLTAVTPRAGAEGQAAAAGASTTAGSARAMQARGGGTSMLARSTSSINLRTRHGDRGASLTPRVAAASNKSDTQNGSSRLPPLMEQADATAAKADAPAESAAAASPAPVCVPVSPAAVSGAAMLPADGLRSDDIELASVAGAQASEAAAPPPPAANGDAAEGSDHTATNSQ